MPGIEEDLPRSKDRAKDMICQQDATYESLRSLLAHPAVRHVPWWMDYDVERKIPNYDDNTGMMTCHFTREDPVTTITGNAPNGWTHPISGLSPITDVYDYYHSDNVYRFPAYYAYKAFAEGLPNPDIPVIESLAQDDDGNEVADYAWMELFPSPAPPATVAAAPGTETYDGTLLEFDPPFPAKWVKFHSMTNHANPATGDRGLSEVQFFGRRVVTAGSAVWTSSPPPSDTDASKLIDAKEQAELSSTNGTDMWLDQDKAEPEITFDLGRVCSVNGVKIWNYAVPTQTQFGVRSMKAAFSVDSSFGSEDEEIIVYLHEADPLNLSGEERRFTDSDGQEVSYDARYIRFSNLSSFSSSTTRFGLSEVQFYGELEYANNLFTGETTKNFADPHYPYYCDQFTFMNSVYPESPDEEDYVKAFVGGKTASYPPQTLNKKNLRCRWMNVTYPTVICPADGIRMIKWWDGTVASDPTDVVALRTPCPSGSTSPMCEYNVWPAECTDDCPQGPCASCLEAPCDGDWYELCHSQLAPWEYRPWGADPGIFIDDSGQDGHALVLRVQDTDCEPCAPTAILWDKKSLKPVPISTLLASYDGTDLGGDVQLWYGWHIFRMKLCNILGTSQNIDLDSTDRGLTTGFDWDVEHRIGVNYDGLDVGVKQQGRSPRVMRIGGKGRDLTVDYFLYRIFITPQVFRAYIDDEKFIDIPSHGLGKSMMPMEVRMQLNIYGFRHAEYGDAQNTWTDESYYMRVPPPLIEAGMPPRSGPDRDMKIDYYCHIPLGLDPEGYRFEWNEILQTREIPNEDALFFEEDEE
jgi:hypothetical protein